MCTGEGRVTEATVCDHVDGHPDGETEAMFWTGPFQSLCKRHHDSDKQRMERGRVIVAADVDGWPMADARRV